VATTFCSRPTRGSFFGPGGVPAFHATVRHLTAPINIRSCQFLAETPEPEAGLRPHHGLATAGEDGADRGESGAAVSGKAQAQVMINQAQKIAAGTR
jgi:hypothetical protein